MNLLEDIQGLGSETYPLLVMVAAIVITFFLFLIALVHILTEPRMPIKAKLFWIIISLILVFPTHVYNTLFIKNQIIKHLSWITGLALLISGAINFFPDIITAVQEKKLEQSLRSDIEDVKPIFDKDELPELYHFMHQILARTNVAQEVCGWSPKKRLSFIGNSELFLYESVQYFLKNTSYSFKESEEMLRIYQEKLIDEARPPSDIDKEAYCNSPTAENLKLFYKNFIDDPKKVQRQMGIRTKD